MFNISNATMAYFDAGSVEDFGLFVLFVEMLSNKFRNTRPMLVDTLLLYG